MSRKSAAILITKRDCRLIGFDCENHRIPEANRSEVLNGFSLTNLSKLPNCLAENFQAHGIGSEPDELSIIMLSDDEFPSWPQLDYAAFSPLARQPLLIIKGRPNLRAAWSAEATGARAGSLKGRTICSITLQEEYTDIAICCNGDVIDTASMAIGTHTIQFTPELQITAISDAGETFLDAVAKKIKAADLVEETLINLLSALMAEALVNLVCRKKAPQVTQRLLSSDPLKHDYDIDDIILSGKILPYVQLNSSESRRLGHLGGYLAQNLLASFDERQRPIALVQAPTLAESIRGSRFQAVSLIDVSCQSIGIVDYVLTGCPVIKLPDAIMSDGYEKAYANTIEERIRRFGIEPGAPMLLSLEMPLEEKEDASPQLSLSTVKQLELARKAIDAAMFLKKPREVVVLLTNPGLNESEALARTKLLYKQISDKQLNMRLILVERNNQIINGDYVSWHAAGSRFESLIQRIYFAVAANSSELAAY